MNNKQEQLNDYKNKIIDLIYTKCEELNIYILYVDQSVHFNVKHNSYFSFLSSKTIKDSSIKGRNLAKISFYNIDNNSFNALFKYIKSLDFIKEIDHTVKYIDDPVIVNKIIYFKYYSYNELMTKKLNYLINDN